MQISGVGKYSFVPMMPSGDEDADPLCYPFDLTFGGSDEVGGTRATCSGSPWIISGCHGDSLKMSAMFLGSGASTNLAHKVLRVFDPSPSRVEL